MWNDKEINFVELGQSVSNAECHYSVYIPEYIPPVFCCFVQMLCSKHWISFNMVFLHKWGPMQWMFNWIYCGSVHYQISWKKNSSCSFQVVLKLLKLLMTSFVINVSTPLSETIPEAPGHGCIEVKWCSSHFMIIAPTFLTGIFRSVEIHLKPSVCSSTINIKVLRGLIDASCVIPW